MIVTDPFSLVLQLSAVTCTLKFDEGSTKTTLTSIPSEVILTVSTAIVVVYKPLWVTIRVDEVAPGRVTPSLAQE
jgi:hypothetical protein